MFINHKLAEEIMREINTVMPYYSNIMDGTGTILTCTDSARIGTTHEGTRIIIENDLDELIVDRENQYQGCRMGVVMTIRFASEIVGFIGIAGKPEEIINYCRLIQRMVGMIVYEKFEESHREEDEQARLLFIESLIQGNTSNTLFNIEETMSHYGLNKQGSFTVGILKHPGELSLETDSEFQKTKHKIILKSIVTQLEHKSILVGNKNSSSIFISNMASEKLYKILDEIIRGVQNQYKLSLLCSVGKTYHDYMEIPKSYKEALSTMKYLEDNENEGVYLYDPGNLNFIISNISSIHQENLINNVFKNCTPKEVGDYKNFITAYFNCNGSLNALSQKYYIHKNTVQYKIQKILNKTGLDMRITHDLFILYIASIT